MEANIPRIKEKLDKYDSEIKCSLTRRGLCGQINIDTVFEKLKRDFALTRINLTREGKTIEIYKLDDNTFFKRLCVCDKPCGTSNCSTKKTKGDCDGHHAMVLSPRPDLDINETDDYVIDFTYKQMIYGNKDSPIVPYEEKENNPTNVAIMEGLPGYLFIKYNEYVDYRTTSVWIKNITSPCKNIVNFENKYLVDSPYYIKYQLYKKKYLTLKEKLKV